MSPFRAFFQVLDLFFSLSLFLYSIVSDASSTELSQYSSEHDFVVEGNQLTQTLI